MNMNKYRISWVETAYYSTEVLAEDEETARDNHNFEGECDDSDITDGVSCDLMEEDICREELAVLEGRGYTLNYSPNSANSLNIKAKQKENELKVVKEFGY
jgi:hypothetical protein